MKSTAMLVAASAALASAQVTSNPNGTFTCATPNAAYCAGTSLGTDIIIRCDSNGLGQPGRCSDNLAGEPPVGVVPALCWQTSDTSGDAACEKNCVVYGSSGNFNGTFTLPLDVCTPTFTATTTSTTATTGVSTTYPTTTVTPTTTYPTTTTYPSSSTCTTLTTTYPPPAGTGSGPVGGNTTYSTYTTYNTPTGPSSTTGPSTVPTAGASLNKAGGAIAALGLIAAYLL